MFIRNGMPPTRGHDLKPDKLRPEIGFPEMPPTRGHDLKLWFVKKFFLFLKDAPHTGARLETLWFPLDSHSFTMPPTRGHDLKRGHSLPASGPPTDAPHTGARLETPAASTLGWICCDAPHTGARLETILLIAQWGGTIDAPHTGARLETGTLATSIFSQV